MHVCVCVKGGKKMVISYESSQRPVSKILNNEVLLSHEASVFLFFEVKEVYLEKCMFPSHIEDKF